MAEQKLWVKYGRPNTDRRLIVHKSSINRSKIDPKYSLGTVVLTIASIIFCKVHVVSLRPISYVLYMFIIETLLAQLQRAETYLLGRKRPMVSMVPATSS